MPSNTDKIVRKAIRLGMREDHAHQAAKDKNDIGHAGFRELVQALEKNNDEYHSVDPQKYGA